MYKDNWFLEKCKYNLMGEIMTWSKTYAETTVNPHGENTPTFSWHCK